VGEKLRVGRKPGVPTVKFSGIKAGSSAGRCEFKVELNQRGKWGQARAVIPVGKR